TRIHNVVIVGDRMIGLTPKNRCVIGQLIPDIIENTGMRMEVEPMEEVNKLGSVDLIEPVPNSEDLFLVAIKNTIYQFDIWGDMTRFDELEDEVQCINSINFNHTSSVLATNRGLYEIDVQEMPNMVKTQSLPRRISANHLRDEFEVALYTEDPYVLGIHPAVGIFSKTKDKKLYFF
ncbi:hypothetical protein NC796_04805, partial [Aliifodinibius sp. S!AR15-10]|uniref:hypothetical protein n=1 Tax=Aliifodinibius sp. S!AR15-10 TaxID=2950437 RepID=UPI002862DA96